jgi:16S rRNA (cytidine1402-2'-O)-methyltransferase
MAAMMSDAPPSAGTLWIVATPIGNLGDLSPRAAGLLAKVPVIAAEDKRVSSRLIDRLEGAARLVVLNEHSEARQLKGLLAELSAGHDVALVSDAGTPLVSDPGYRLVFAAHDAGLRVSPVPGPCAAIAALSVAGLPSDRFWFEGFLPARQAARCQRLQLLADCPSTMIFYVPARDLETVLKDLSQIMGVDRPAALGRELTKLHETVRRGTLASLAEFCHADPNQARGEAVLLVGGSPDEPLLPVDPRALAHELARELAPSRAAAVLSRLTSLTRKQAWTLIERVREEEPSLQGG